MLRGGSLGGVLGIILAVCQGGICLALPLGLDLGWAVNITLARFTALDCSSESAGSPALLIATGDGDVGSVSDSSPLLSDCMNFSNGSMSKKSTSSMLTKEPATQPTVGETLLMAPRMAKTKKSLSQHGCKTIIFMQAYVAKAAGPRRRGRCYCEGGRAAMKLGGGRAAVV